VNFIGFSTLLRKETRRYLRVPAQTVAQPVVSTTLYFLIFGFAMGGRLRDTAPFGGVPYARFIIPGLVMMALITNAFLNSASSMFVMKLQGTIVDLLVAPLGAGELLAAFVLGAVGRGLLVGTIVWLVAALFTTFRVAHPAWVLVSALLTSGTFALVGLAVAIWSEKFEQLNLVPTFVITPLTFLGGVFYSPNMLPEPWATITRANPILYMVEGLRYGLIGVSSSPPWIGLAITSSLFLACGALVAWMLASGYKLRS
jgi:ABC-2 type transport system permease protein